MSCRQNRGFCRRHRALPRALDHLQRHPSARLQPARPGPERQRGVRARLRRDGADRAGALGGLDLSVGAVMTLVDCIASRCSSTARPSQIVFGCIVVCLVAGAARGLRQRPRRRLRPHPADHRDAGDRRGLHRPRAHHPARARRRGRRGPQLGADQRAAATSPRPTACSTAARPPGSSPSPGSRCR